MKRSNNEMMGMLEALAPLLDRRDVIGYAAARNTRLLSAELSEYSRIRDELVMKYGEAEIGEDGNPTGRVSIAPTSANFRMFLDEIGRFAEIEHEPELFLIKYEEAIGKLSGSELLAVEWMFED